jgi:hypothetical protein
MDALPTTTGDARKVGQLSFALVLPAQAGRLLAVYVSDPTRTYAGARNVTLVYDYPRGPDFPLPGQVVIGESEAGEVAAKDLARRAASNPCIRLINLANGQAAYQQVTDRDYGGRVTFVRGKIVFNVEGPRVARASILAVANALP